MVIASPIRRPELLLPAGDMEKLKTAVRFGADAVYLGTNAFGLRAHAGNFPWMICVRREESLPLPMLPST